MYYWIRNIVIHFGSLNVHWGYRMFIFYAILVFMILGSIIAIETKNLLSSVISVGVVGFALSVLFLMLAAPDIAITHLVVEVLSLIVLIRATITPGNTDIEEHRDTFAMVSSLVFLGLFVVLASYAFLEMPKFGEPLLRVAEKYLTNGLSDTGASNIVTAIILDYRAYDTLGEASVIFVSVYGAIVLIRKTGRKIKNNSIDISLSQKGE